MGKKKAIKLVEYDDGVTRKTCSKCLSEYPLDNFHISKAGLGGRASRCKSCIATFFKKYNKTNNTRYKAFEENGILYKFCKYCDKTLEVIDFHRKGSGYSHKCKTCRSRETAKGTGPPTVFIEVIEGVEHKKCRKCNIVKPLEEYPKQSNKGVGGKRANCKKCERVIWKQYREKNREKTTAASRKWRINNPDKQKISSRKWLKLNPDKDKVYQNRRKASLRSLRNDLTTEQWKSIVDDFDGSCALTGTKEGVTMDHFIPISTGKGGTYLGNVYPLASSVNGSKSNRNPFEWFSTYGKNFNITSELWYRLIEYLASQNKMSIKEFTEYVELIFYEREDKYFEDK